MSADIIQALQFVFSSRYETDPAGAKAFSKETQAIIKGAEDVAEALKGSGTDITKRMEMISTAVKDTAKQLSRADFAKHDSFSSLINEEAKKLKISGKNLIAAKQNIIKNFSSGDDKALQSSKLGKAFFENLKNIDSEWDTISVGYEAQARKFINTVIKSNQKTDAALKAVVDSRAKWEYNIAKQSRQLATAQQDSYKTSLDSIFKEIEKRRISAKEAEKRLQELSRQIEIDLSQQTASISSAKTQTGGFQTEAKAKDLGSKLSKAASDSTSIITKQIASDMITTINEMVEGFKDGRLSLVQFNNEFQKTNVEAQELLRNHKSITAEQKEQEKETLNENKLLEKINTTIKDVRESWQKVAQFDEMKHLTALVNAQLEEMAALTNRIGNEDMGILNSDLKQINNELDSINNSYIELSKRKKIIGKKEATDLRIRELTTGPVAFNINDEKIQNVRKLFDDLYASQNLTSKSTKQLDDEFSHLKNTITELKIEKGNMMQADSAERRSINDLRTTVHELQGSFYAVQVTAQTVFSFIKDAATGVVNTFAQFEQQLNKFAAVSYKPGESASMVASNLRKFGDEAARVGENSRLLITDVEKAGVVLAKMGFNAQQATGMLKTVVLAAEASGESVVTVAEAIATVAATYGENAQKLAQPVEHISDVITAIALNTKANIEEIGTSFKYLGSVAAETGQDFHTVSAMLEVMGKHGITGSQAGTSGRQILTHMVKPTKEATEMMEILGVTTKKTNGEIKNAEEFFKDYTKALHGLSEEVKGESAKAMFGQTALPSALAMVSELEKDSESFSKIIKNHRDEINGLTETMKDIQFRGVIAETEKLKSNIESLAISFGENLKGEALGVISVLGYLVSALSNTSEGTKTLISTLGLLGGGAAAVAFGLSTMGLVVSQLIMGWAALQQTLLAADITFKALWTTTLGWLGTLLALPAALAAVFSGMHLFNNMIQMNADSIGGWTLKIGGLTAALVLLAAPLALAVAFGGTLAITLAGIGTAIGALIPWFWESQKAQAEEEKAIKAVNDVNAIRLSTQGDLKNLLKEEASGADLAADKYMRMAHALREVGKAQLIATKRRVLESKSALEEYKNLPSGQTMNHPLFGEMRKGEKSETEANIKMIENAIAGGEDLIVKQTELIAKNQIIANEKVQKAGAITYGGKFVTDTDKLYSDLIGYSAKAAKPEQLSSSELMTLKSDLAKTKKAYELAISQIPDKLEKKQITPERAKALKEDYSNLAKKIEQAIKFGADPTKAAGSKAAFDIEKAQLGLFSKQTDLLEQQTKYQHTLMALEEKKIALAEKAIDIEELKQKLVQAGGDPANIPGGAVGSLSGIGLKAANQEADQLISIAERVSGAYGTCYNTVYRAYRKHFGDEGMFGKISGDTIPAYKAAVDLAKDARYFEVQLDKNKDFWSQIKKGDTGVFDAGGRSDFSYKYGHIENYDPEKKMAHHFSHDKLPAGRNMRGMRLFRLKSWQSAGADPQTQRPSGKLKSHEELTIQRQELLSQKDKLTQEKARKIQEEIDELKKRLGTVPKVSGSAPKLSEEVIAQKEGESDKDFKKRQTQFNAEQKATEAKLKNFDKAKGEFNEISQSIADKEKELMELTGESMETETRRLQLELERKQKEKEIQQSELSFIKDMIEMETQLLELNYMQRDAADSSYQANLRNIKLQEDASWEQEKALYSLTDSDREKSKSHQKYLRQVEIETIKHFRVLEQLDKEYINRQFELDSQMAEMKAQSLSDDITRLKSLAAIESTKRKKKFNDDMEEARKKQGYEAIQAKISENYRKEELIADRNLKIELLKSIEEVTQKRYEAMTQQISMASKLGADVLDAASMDRRRSTVGNVKESIEAYDALKNAMAGPLFITEKMLDEQVSGLNEVNKLRQYQLVLIDKEIQAMRDNGKPQSEINEMVQKRKVLADELLKSQILASDLTKQSVKDFIKLSQQAKQTKEDMTKMGESFEQFSGGLGKLMDAMSGGDSGFASFFSGMNEGWKSITDLTEKYIAALAQISAINGSIDDQSFIPKTIDGTKQLIALGKQLGESSKKNDILSFEDMLKENSKVTNKEKIGDIKNQLVKIISPLIGNNEDMLNWGDIAKEALVSSGGSMTGSSPEEKMDLIKRMLFKGQNLASAGINAASGLKIPKLWDKNRNVGTKSKGLPKKQGEWGDIGKDAMSGMDGDNQAADLISTIGGVASAVIPVAGTVMSIIGGAIGFFGEMDKKKKELEKELAVSRADLLAAEAEFLDKRADIFFEKGDISAALYQENKIIAARKKFQAELDKTNIEIREQEEKAKPGWFGFIGEEQKIAQAKADQLKMQKATKFEELPQQMRDVEAEAAKKSVERENELLDANVRVRKVKAELYGDSIGLIQIEAEEKNNALNKELELGYIEQKRLGYTEQANKKVLELERAILQERMKLNSQTQLSIKLEGQRLLMTSEQIKNRSAENLNPYAKGELTKSQENLRLEDAQREVDLMKEYAEWQGKAQAYADKGQAIPSYILDAVTASKAELDDIINARKKGGLSTKSQATLDEQRKVQESNLYKMGNEVERINAQLRDDQFKQAELDELDALRDLEDAKRQEKRKYNADDSVNQLKVDKSFSAKEEKIRRDTAERKVQIEMDWRKRVRDLSASEAANTSDDLDDIKIAYANTSAEIADEWGKAKQFMSGDKLAQREKELLSQQLAANISYFNALAELRKRDLDEIIELDNLKAQNTRDSLNIAVTDYQGQMQQIMYDEAVALERYKDNEAKKAYYTEYYEEKKKNLKINAEKSVADAAIDQLNKLSQVKELQFELEMRVYEKEIKANERKISDLQRKIDKLERDKAKIEREIDEAQRKFKVEDKGKFKADLGGINIDQTLRDALEYISNPTANQTKDAAMETAMDAVKTQVDYLKSKAESAYALEDIDATEYYRQMISAVLQQAKAAQYALANLDTEQEAEMQRYILAGKNEDELRVVRKHHMLERMKMEGMYSDAYKDYQKLNDEALEVTRKEEIEAIDEKIDKEKQAIEDLQWINEDKKRIIEDARFKMEEVTDKIKEKVQDLTLATGNWGFSLEDAKNDAMGVFNAIITGYDAAKLKLAEVLTLKVDAPILDLLAKLSPTNFGNIVQQTNDSSATGMTTGLVPVKNQQSAQTTGMVNNPYVGKNGYEFSPSVTDIKRSTTQQGEFIVPGYYPDGRAMYFTNSSDRDAVMRADKVPGYAEGRAPMFTGNGSARPGDYLPAMVKNNEWIVPDDKMREMARGMAKDAFGGRAMTGGATTFNMSFGNVYGVDDLKGTINEAIRKANMDDGYHNSVYLVGNN